MTPQAPRPPWRRRPIFLWQLRILLFLSTVLVLSRLPPLLRLATAHFRDDPTIANPCHHRPSPPPLPSLHNPPTLFFIHLPKTAGTLMYKLLLQYANRTAGLACNFVHDGNRLPPYAFVAAVTSPAAPPPTFPKGSDEHAALAAISRRDYPAKAALLRKGACRALRGHVTYAAVDAVHDVPVLTATILRDPLARFVSMYEFALSMIRPPAEDRVWKPWLGGSTSLAAEFANSSSLVHRGFYDDAGHWASKDNVGLSFHFYGVLHQLSGMTPVFQGVGDPYHFAMRNDAEMAEKAKDNLCRTHVLGAQESMEETWRQFFGKVGRYAEWSQEEKRIVSVVNVNRTPMRRSRNVDDHLPERIRQELERRLAKEIEVVEFGRRIIEYRKALREQSAERVNR